MTYSPAEFAARRHLLGLTIDDLAGILEVNPRTVRAWESGRDLVPARIATEVDGLVAEHTRLVEDMLASETIVGIIRDKDDPGARMPRGWYVAAAARAIEVEPDLEVEWV